MSAHATLTPARELAHKNTLHVRPAARAPVPDVHLVLSAWDGGARDVEQRVALAVIARSPIERLIGLTQERGWRGLRLYADTAGEFSRD